MKDKRIIEYIKKYGDIPKDFCERFVNLIHDLNINTKELEKISNMIQKIIAIHWLTQQFVIYMEPKATPRPRFSFKTKRSYVPNASANHTLFGEFAEKNLTDFEPITTPAIIILDVFLPIPEQMSKVEKVLAELKFIKHISKPDGDNLLKAYSDMIQKHVIVDDSLVTEMHVRKFYSIKPRAELTIKYMEKFDCKYNKNKVKKWNNVDKEKVEEKWEE